MNHPSDAPTPAPDVGAPGNTEDAQLARMYPSMAQQSQAAAAAASPVAAPDPGEETAAERMFGGRETLRSEYGPALKDQLDRLSDHTGMSPEEREATLDAAAEFFSDARISSSTAPTLYSLLASAVVEPPDDATVEQWATETRRELREHYGDDAGRRLEAAQKFIAARPDLQKTLNETGLGSHPRIVLALTENATQMRMVPRKRK
jgi:hypothetical protein